MFRAHVLIIRRSKLHYTASGTITPTGGHVVHRLTKPADNCLSTFIIYCIGITTFPIVYMLGLYNYN